MPSGIVGISALNEAALALAVALPGLAGTEALAVGVTGEGVLARVEPGDYGLSYARCRVDEESYLELYRLQRTS